MDDNLDAAQTLTDMLHLAGHAVQVAHTAQSALALVKRALPQIALRI